MRFHSTTILAVRRGRQVALGGDGQVTFGNTIVKSDASKVRTLQNGQVLVGFAGAVADAFALLERFEQKLSAQGGNLLQAAVALSRDWRTDRVLRRLDSMIAAVDREHSLMLAGTGEVIQPSDGIVAIGSGSGFALAAARALHKETQLSAREIVQRALEITADICIYTNTQLRIEVLE
ncbi:MAG: ATP-dependent protease subunit HslV [Planctomycetota bacterium]